MCQVDGSIEAADAVVVAGQLARAWSVELHVVHVWSGLASAFTGLVAEDAARRLLFGSVAAEILRVTVRPLLLVSSAADWPPTRLLVGDDGSPAALAGARLAAQITSLYHAELQLVRADGAPLGGGGESADVTVAEEGLTA